MSNDLIQYAFVAGELSEKLLGRTDFEKYDLGLKKAFNWFVDYRGGLTTRAGLGFCEWMPNPTLDSKMFSFEFSPETSNTYVVLFAPTYIYFLQDGGYVLEASKNISAVTAADPAVFSVAAHGYSTGDLIYVTGIVGPDQLNGAVYQVTVTGAGTFTLTNLFGDTVDASALDAYVSGGTASRVYRLAHGYATADLSLLQAKQSADYLRLTHPNYKVKNLIRSGHADWDIENEDFLEIIGRVATPDLDPSALGAAGVIYAVTWIDEDGNESLPSFRTNQATVDFTVTAGHISITWDAKAGAKYYNIYRTRVLEDGNELNWAMSFGYLGTAFGPKFVDNNIIPDFTQTFPTHRDPFSPNQVESITITNDGSGYDEIATTIVATGSGSGFYARPVVVGGEIVSIRIFWGGRNYATPPAITFPTGGGSGAAATAVLTDADGCFPRTSSIFQQRQIYAGSEDNPLRIWGSRPGRLNNFDDSDIITDDCAFQFDIDSLTVSPIKHLVPVRGGLLAMTEAGIWLLSGDAGRALTPTNAVADPQTFTGVSDTEPLTIDTELIYVTAKEAGVRLLSYNDFSKIYGGQDMSILSSHLFSPTNPIIRWAYAEAPYRMITAVRADGSFLYFAVVKEQNVFAWTRGGTQGVVTDVVKVSESGHDVVYVTVKRYLNDQWVKFIERFTDREAANLNNAEDAVCLDSALTLDATYPAANLISDSVGVEGELNILTASASVFTGTEGQIVRCGGGKFVIISVLSGTAVTTRCLRSITAVIPNTETPIPFDQGEWTMDDPVTVIQGLHHLEGQTVSILGDGNVLTPQEVINGEITLPVGVTRATVGVQFICEAETLPLVSGAATIEGRRKRSYGAAIRRYQSKGLKFGSDRNALYNMKERTTELNGEPTRLQSDIRYEIFDGIWEADASLHLVVEAPLPVSILGFTQDVEVGDDKS